MTNVTAKIKIKGKNFEVLVDVDKALAFRKNQASVSEALISDNIFKNIKSGEHASESDLKGIFGTEEVNIVAEKIIKSGEIQIPSDYKNKEREDKVKQAVDFISKNAVDPKTGNPYTPKRIEESISQAGINIENRPIEEQMSRILEKLKVILPIKIETKKLSVKVPAIHTGRVYGLLKEYKEREEWLNNGDLIATINIPVGMQMDFYDKLNSITHGSAIVQEIKQNV